MWKENESFLSLVTTVHHHQHHHSYIPSIYYLWLTVIIASKIFRVSLCWERSAIEDQIRYLCHRRVYHGWCSATGLMATDSWKLPLIGRWGVWYRPSFWFPLLIGSWMGHEALHQWMVVLNLFPKADVMSNLNSMIAALSSKEMVKITDFLFFINLFCLKIHCLNGWKSSDHFIFWVWSVLVRLTIWFSVLFGMNWILCQENFFFFLYNKNTMCLKMKGGACEHQVRSQYIWPI